MKRVDIAAGAVSALAPATSGAGGRATWNRDDAIVFADTSLKPLFVVSAREPGAVKAVTTLQRGQVGHVSPHFLPDGQHFLYVANGTPDVSGLFVRSLDGRCRRFDAVTSLPNSSSATC